MTPPWIEEITFLREQIKFLRRTASAVQRQIDVVETRIDDLRRLDMNMDKDKGEGQTK